MDEGVEQLNLAFDQYGVNFLDTAEMYPGNVIHFQILFEVQTFEVSHDGNDKLSK